MTSTTFGPPVTLDGPLPSPPPRSLLTVPGVLQDPGDVRWTAGVSLWGYPEGMPAVWNPCSSGTSATKSDDSSIPSPTFASFVIYLPVTCSSFGIAADPEGFARKAEVALDAVSSWAIEYALAHGVPTTVNPYLADADVDILASGAGVGPTAALSYLEEAIGATGRGGMIHATPGAASAMFGPWRDYIGADNGARPALVSPLGTPIAVGGGYAGATPFGGSAAGAGRSWAFATGPVQAFLESVQPLNMAQVLDRTMNDVTFRAERYALVEWDTALRAAVLVDWDI